MIRHDFANDLLEEINVILTRYSQEEKITFIKRRQPADEYFQHRFDYNFFNLPYRIVPIAGSVVIHSQFYEIDQYYYGATENLSKEKIEKRIKEIEDRNSNIEELEFDAREYLENRTSNLVFFFQKVMTKVRDMDELQGITDEEKIIINFLNFYQEIVKSETHQIDIGIGITYPKEVADLFTKILIRYLKMRLELLNPKLKPVEDEVVRSIKMESSLKLIWKGNQKDLLELIVELQNKGWLEPLQRGQLTKAAKSICNLFDLSTTKKTPESDEVASFNQLLKGTMVGSEREYNYGKNHIPKFQKILPNQI